MQNTETPQWKLSLRETVRENRDKQIEKARNKAKQKKEVKKKEQGRVGDYDSNAKPIINPLIPEKYLIAFNALNSPKRKNLLKLFSKQTRSFNKDREQVILRLLYGWASKRTLKSSPPPVYKSIPLVVCVPIKYNLIPKVTPKLGPEFYVTREWRELRYHAIKFYGRTCMCCGASNTQIHVDHIKPRSIFPELELKLENLQILCVDCNLGKSNKDFTDFRNENNIF
jgi:hypothetical protein